MQKTARFMRMLKEASVPPPIGKTEGDKSTGWWVTAALFKVNPPIEYTTYETYRKGKLLKDERFSFRRHTRLREHKMNPLNYTYRRVKRTTAFVVSSAADLATMMDRSNQSMIAIATERKKIWEAMVPEDEAGRRMKAEFIAQQNETIALFSKDKRLNQDVETYLFPAHKDGAWKDGGELEGSQKSTLNLAQPFENIGYMVIGLPEQAPRPYEMTPPMPSEMFFDWLTREDQPAETEVAPGKITPFVQVDVEMIPAKEEGESNENV
jgi:hypothetical protein